MEDRVSLYPGRVTLTPVEGQPNTYDMVRADQPTQQGTALSKANLLKDTTAAQFGLGSEAVPDDVLSWIGKYNEYWWSLLHGEAYTAFKEKKTSVATDDTGNVSDLYFVAGYVYGVKSNTIQYSSTITINQSTGIVSLSNPTELEINVYNISTLNALIAKIESIAPCYVTGIYNHASEIYYIPASPTNTSSSNTAEATLVYYGSGSKWDLGINQSVYCTKPAYLISAEAYTVPAGETTYEHSTDRNACPDSGTVDGITYTYLGCPFEKLPGAVQIAMGSYMGTGVYGSNNANKLTFDFAPKLLMVRKDGYSYGSAVQTTNNSFYCIIMDLMTAQITDDFSSTVAYNAPISVNTVNSIVNAVDTYSIYVKKSTDEKTIAWKGANVNLQMNTANIKYYYVALG